MRKAVCLALMLTVLLGLTGCGGKQETAEEPKLLLGFSQLGSESSFRIGNTKDIEEQAEACGISLMMKNANQKQEKQIADIRSLIAYRVDVIAFSPIVEEGWDTVLTEAKNAGIPVVLVDRTIQTRDDSLYAAQIGSDFYREGVMAAEYLIRKADQLGMDRVNIVEIRGTENSTPMKQRQQGFMDTIAGDVRMRVLDSADGDFLRSRGAECMREMLKTHGNQINAVFSHNDEMTIGALPEIEAAGYAPGKDILLISIDGGQDAIDILKEGKINCIVECTPKLGSVLMETAVKLKNGEAVERVIHPEERIFTDDEDLSLLAPRGY
ncbi:MAG: ABC transporter substrate-binding protein [Clostridia bacterium]|nr:ABC transporter substrate-binding protein [Clostridia bacterium]